MEYVGNIIYDDELFLDNRNFVIFGAGKNGKRILEYLKRNGLKDRIACFGVSNIEENVHSMEGIPVCCIGHACRQYPDAAYLVSGKYVKEMCLTLRENGIKGIHVLFF